MVLRLQGSVLGGHTHDRGRLFRWIKILALIAILCPTECSPEKIPVGCLGLETGLDVKMIGNKVASNWTVEDAGLSKIFTYDEMTTFPNRWESSHGESFYLHLGLRPVNRLLCRFGGQVVGSYADTLYRPVNEEHRLYSTKERFRWIRGELKYEGEWLEGSLFRGIGHPHWGEEGDIFGLYPEQYDIDNYRRVSGRVVPRGAQFTINKFVGGKFTIVTGPEVVWGSDWSTYAKYNFCFARSKWALIYKDEMIKWGEENEHLRAGEISVQARLLDVLPFQIGLLYQPFRIGWDYTFVKGSPPYTADDIKKAKTDTSDAIGVKVILPTRDIPGIDRVTLGYTYCGLVAGNKHEVKLRLEKSILGSLSSLAEFVYRRPIVGPVPYIYQGTEDNPGPPLATPRGENDPFWVNHDNREAALASLCFTYDPTPGTWFYRWQPGILEGWNLNPEEDAKVSFAVGYFLSYFPTATDLGTYYDQEGKIVWETSYSNGMWPTKRPIHSVALLVRLRTTGPVFVLNIRGGESLATGGMAYTVDDDKEKPETDFFSLTLGMTHGPYNLEFGFASCIWGPEEWHRRFGETIDQEYKASLSRKIGRHCTLGVEYIGYRETDGKYIAQELGAFDEVRVFFKLRFSSLFRIIR